MKACTRLALLCAALALLVGAHARSLQQEGGDTTPGCDDPAKCEGSDTDGSPSEVQPECKEGGWDCYDNPCAPNPKICQRGSGLGTTGPDTGGPDPLPPDAPSCEEHPKWCRQGEDGTLFYDYCLEKPEACVDPCTLPERVKFCSKDGEGNLVYNYCAEFPEACQFTAYDPCTEYPEHCEKVDGELVYNVCLALSEEERAERCTAGKDGRLVDKCLLDPTGPNCMQMLEDGGSQPEEESGGGSGGAIGGSGGSDTACPDNDLECRRKNGTVPINTAAPGRGGQSGSNNSNAGSTCQCTMQYLPVCGYDGKLYGNACQAACDKAATRWPCGARGASCAKDCKAAAAKPCPCTKIKLPVCGVDGKVYPNACEAKCKGGKKAVKKACGKNGALVCASLCRDSAQRGCSKCDFSWAPVCAKSNGVVYGNKCLAACVKQKVRWACGSRKKCGVDCKAAAGPPPCTCPKSSKPVCSKAGKVFPNECEAKCAKAPIRWPCGKRKNCARDCKKKAV